MEVFDEETMNRFGSELGDVTNAYMDFVKNHVPSGIACVFAFTKNGDHIGVVVGGHDPNDVTYDMMVVKLAQQVGNRRNEKFVEKIIDAGRRESKEELPESCWPFPTGAKN